MALQITFSAEDHLALVMGIGSNDVQLPQRTITRADFPGCPEDAIGQPVPILYGDLRESVGTTLEAPTWAENYTQGMRWAGPWNITDQGRQSGIADLQWAAGVADITSPAAPTIAAGGVTATTGGQIPLNVLPWVNRFYITCAVQNPAGTWSNFFPKMLYDVTWDSRATTPDIAVTAGIHYVDYTSAADDNKINVTFAWPAGATTGWTCRVWLVWNYYGPRADQYIDVAHPATTCSFDKFGIAAGGALTGTGRVASTGATLWNGWASGGQSWWTVRAYNASGVGPESSLTSGVTAPYHPMYLQWTAVSGATGYILTQYLTCTMAAPDWGIGVTPLRTWDVGNVTSSSTIVSGTWPGSLPVDATTETPTKGIPVRHVGQLADSADTLWEAWLVCGHAVTSVDAVYLDHVRVGADVYGAELAVPGQTGFATFFGATTYRDLNGARYTLLYARGTLAADLVGNARTVTVDVRGIETVGDGSGSLITDLFEQYEHLLRNWIPATALGRSAYLTGAWQTSGPMWGDTPYDVDAIDGASFVAAKAIADARISGGYTGAFGVGLDGFASVRDWIARLNQSADCYCGFSRKSQFVVKLLHATQALVDAAPRYSDTLGILRDSFAIEDDVLMIENQLTGRYDHNWVNATWRRGLTLEDVDAQTAVGEIRPYELRLYCTRNPTQAFDITNRRLTRRKYPYRTVSFESDMGALTIDLGDLVRITHFDGLGASGWTDRAAWVLRHEFDPARFVVAIDALDVDYLINPLVEDASWMATVELGALGGSFVVWSEDLGLLGTEAVTVTEGKTATAS